MKVIELKTILAFAGKNDSRPFLNGIFVDFDKRVIAASNGAAIIEVKGCNVEGSGRLIIPRDAVELAIKGLKKGRVKITPSSIGPVNYEPISKKYPEYECVFPSTVDEKRTFGLYASENLKRLEDAIKTFGAVKYDTAGAGTLFAHGNKIRVVIVELRV